MRLSSAIRTALLGPAYHAHRRLITESRNWSTSDTEQYQKPRVSKLLARYGDAIRSKDHYRANLGRYTVLSIPGITKRVATGGTTGTPFSFRMDTFARRQKERAYIFDIWSEAGYEPFDLRVIYRGNIGGQLISYDWLENAYTISPAQLSRANVDFLVDFLRKLDPFFLHVYPSSLLALIDLIGEEAMRTLPIRGVFAGSEAFPPPQIHAIERRLGVQVVHWYGHSEYATLARYCKHCEGFHFYPTYGYTEFVDMDEGLHHIVATSFNSLGTRFVRYDTGDIALLNERVCEKPYHRIQSVLGRTQEYFIAREGSRLAFGPFLFGIHNQFWELTSAIQFIQRMPGYLTVRIAFKPTTSLNDQKWAKAFLESRFSPVDLDFSIVNSIAPTASGKHRYFVNELAMNSP